MGLHFRLRRLLIMLAIRLSLNHEDYEQRTNLVLSSQVASGHISQTKVHSNSHFSLSKMEISPWQDCPWIKCCSRIMEDNDDDEDVFIQNVFKIVIDY